MKCRNLHTQSRLTGRVPLSTKFLMAFLLFLGLSQGIRAQQITMEMVWVGSTSTTADFDILLSNTSSNGATLKFNSIIIRGNHAANLLQGGLGTISWAPLNNNTLPEWNNGTAGWPNVTSCPYTAGSRLLNYGSSAAFFTSANAPTIPTGTPVNIGRFRMTVTGGTWVSNSQFGFVFAATAGVVCYINGSPTTSPILATQGTSINRIVPASQPLNVPTNTCATSGLASNLGAVTCFGGNNGSATITMSPAPSNTSITYSVDGGAATPATLTAGGAFNVTGLTTGSHSIVVTNPSCSNVTVPVMISGPTSALTNTTTQTACDSFVWSVTGQTYTQSGTYTGTTTNANGCTVNETLVLTINNSSAHTTTTSACDTFTWAGPLGNGQTYTASTTATNVSTNASGCPHTETLVLTINNSSAHTTTTSACDTFTWAGPLGNGQTYTASTTATNVSTNASGCPHTETLVLTINNSSAHTTTTSACDTFTWAGPLGNGQTYTASTTATNVSTNASGCPHTETLVLTINNSSAHTTTTSACDTFTWAGPLGNGQTYTASTTATNVSTNASGCPHTETLVLTINNSSAHTTTTSACDTFTWAGPLGNGQTYTASTTATNVTTNASGCPHTETLVLTINNSTAHTTTTSACDSFTWAGPLGNGQTYTSSTTATNVSVNASGCPHTETLVLTINSSSAHTTTATACDSYTWSGPLGNGTTYTQGGTYTNVTTNASGCPHVETLALTINTSPVSYYADTDGDGFGAGAAIPSCTGQPANTVLNNTDCAPNDATKWRTGSFYVDADNDGYYNGNPETTAVCYGATVPAGYVSEIIGTDCDDSNANANPNHVEIPANGIDDNCDGSVDEAAPTTSLIAAQCGFTMNNIANQIYASAVPSATAYRFEIVNGSNVRTYDSATNSFSFNNVPGGAAFATTYTIRVAVKTNGFWRSYFTACTVTTPATSETTQVVATQCGTTLPLMSTTIYANQVTAASQYRFEVTNGSNVRTYDSAFNRFSLTNLTGTNNFGTTYIVRVALMIGGVWQDYGAACSITTPATPGYTNVSSPQCGSTITNSWTTIYANPIAGAQGYRFEVTVGATTRFYDTSVPRFSLRNIPSFTVTPNTAYTIRVAILYNSVYQGFGTPCTINTAAAITRQTATAVEAFAVKASPNPFASTFKLEMNTSSEDQVDVKVYDMIGKLIEARQIGVAEFGSLEVGERYPSGVYNIIVTQGENVKTLRVIKR